MAIGLAAQGSDEIRAHLDSLFTAMPDITFDVSSHFVAGDRAVVEWTVSGTYSSDFPGQPRATGQRFSFRGASVFEFADGKIRRYAEYWDAYASWSSLGRCRHRQSRHLSNTRRIRRVVREASMLRNWVLAAPLVANFRLLAWDAGPR